MPDTRAVQISLLMEGSSADNGLVRAYDFVAFLDGVMDCLRRLERHETGAARIAYRVTNLAVGSALIEIAAESTYDNNYEAAAIVNRFVEGAESIRLGGFGFRMFSERFRTSQRH